MRRNLPILLRSLLTIVTLGVVGWYAWRGRAYLEGGWAWDWKWAAAGALLAPVLILGRARKWQVVTRPLDGTVTIGQALRSYLGGLPLAVVSPAKLGELARCLFLPQKAFHGMAGAGRVFVDNWTDVAGSSLWACLGWVTNLELIGWGDAPLLRYGPPAVVLALALPLRFWMAAARRAVRVLPALWGLRAAVERGIPPPQQLPFGNFAAAVTLSVAVWSIEWMQASCLLRFLGGQPPGFLALGGILALVSMTGMMQVTFAGLGVREGLAAYLLAGAGIDFRAALVAAFGQTLLNQMLPALAGLAFKPASVPSRVGAEASREAAA